MRNAKLPKLNSTPKPSKEEPVPPKNRKQQIQLTFIVLTVLGWLLYSFLTSDKPDYEEGELLTYTEFEQVLEQEDITKVWVFEERKKLIVQSSFEENFEDGFAHVFVPSELVKPLSERILAQGIEVEVIPLQQTNIFTSLIFSLLPILLIIGFLFLILRKGGLSGGLGLSKIRTTPVEVPDVRFSDVAGVSEAVSELEEVVTFLHEPERFQAIGAKIPRGFLLAGPPGTGKTLLARAVAGEAGVPFFAISGSDFVEMYAGLGASRVRDVFTKAREANKAILFIDEIDAVAKARGQGGPSNGATDERENTLNQLLVEMDGFDRNSNVVVIGATNRVDVLDPALLRPGRFDRKIMVPAPDWGGRQKILELYATNRPFDPSISWAEVAKRTTGMTGAELEQLLNEASLDAVRYNEETISMERVSDAIATSVLGRARKSALITGKDKRIAAFHEAGHTIAALLLSHAQNPVQVTIIPRGGAAGTTWMSGSDDQFLTKSQAHAQLCVAMAGRAAEEILLEGDYTQGAHGDLNAATDLATKMIGFYGMGSKLVAKSLERLSFDGPGSAALEEEVATLIGQALIQARVLLQRNTGFLNELSEELLARESLFLTDIENIANKHSLSANSVGSVSELSN